MDTGLIIATSAGLLVGGVGVGVLAAWAIDRRAKRRADDEARAARELVDRAEWRAMRADVRGLRDAIDALADAMGVCATPGPPRAEGGAAMACTDVAACDDPDRCDEGCLRAIGPAEAALLPIGVPVGFEHPDAEDSRHGDDGGQDARGAGGGA